MYERRTAMLRPPPLGARGRVDEVHVARGAPVIPVRVLGRERDDAALPAPVLRAETARHQLDRVEHRRRIERGHAAEVERQRHVDPIEVHARVARALAAQHQPAEVERHARHAGQALQRAQRVVHRAGDRADLVAGHRVRDRLGLRRRLARDLDDLARRRALGVEHDVDVVGAGGHRRRGIPVGHHHHRRRRGRAGPGPGQHEPALVVRDRALGRATQDRGAGDRLALGVAHPSAHVIGERAPGGQEEQNRGEP